MGKEVVLMDYWPSMFGMRARIALAEKGVDYDYQEQNPHQKTDVLLKMNPVHKKIPVLVHNGKPVCESLIIVEYIDEVWADRAPLLPSDPYRRAQARFWADYIDKKMNELRRRLYTAKGEEQEKAKEEFIDALKVLEEHALGDKPFFGGDEFGFADVALIPFYSWFYTYEVEANFKVEDTCPMIIAWAKRCMERDSVASSLPDPHKIHGFVLERKKKLGAMFGMRARLALAKKGIDYNYQEQNPHQKTDVLLKMNPVHKKIPVLVHNGKPVCESLIIVEYIDEIK
ncbi:hypothetical protein V2J09_012865 [Rumex salicifolius]